MTRFLISLFSTLLIIRCSMKGPSQEGPNQSKKPNIIVFYVDDLGFGDLSSYGATGVQTKYVDRLVDHGLKLTDAHSTAATCTPSRYSLLTGEYAFRNNAKILPGDAPLLIDTTKTTLPRILARAGYKSAVVGKWHLGLGLGQVNWNEKVSPGPLELGFDYSFLLPATGDRVPTVYLENHDVVNLDPSQPINVSYKKDLGQQKATKENARFISDKQHSQTLINGVGRIGAMTGGESALWIDEEFPNVFTGKAIEFIEHNQEDPFFLFFSFHDIHVPRLPHEKFQGKSEMGPRGDAIVQMDWMTGQIVQKLEELGIDKNTMIVFTSDNGPVLNDGYEDLAEEKIGNHKPAGPYRGGKYSAFEAGTRVPTVVYWPGKVQQGVSNALISQVDMMASFAALVEIELQEGEGIDSENQLEALLGNDPNGREYMLEESYTLGIRNNEWKYILPIPADKNIPKWMTVKKVETGFSSEEQLFNLKKDEGEMINLANDYPEIVSQLRAKLDEIKNVEMLPE
ncbi:MAG: arylsulfatase [Ekhidna sp.]|nr:arylsulfatase [Ekhidna sp.]